jgi:hypothetical protein
MPFAMPRPYFCGPSGRGITRMLLPSSIHASRDCAVKACLLRISTGITVWPLDEMVLVDVVPTMECKTHGVSVNYYRDRLTSQFRRIPKDSVSTGVGRLDTMLSGGYYRGASVLISGFPGTAKSTLSGAFAEAACRRGENTLFVRFESDAN